MKTLELKLKKDVLIVDAENGFNHFKIYDDEIGFIFTENGIPRKELVKGSYKFLCEGSELTEEIASELVEMEYDNFANEWFKDYKIITDDDEDDYLFLNAKPSFISAVESKGFYWLENPIEIIERGEDTEHNRVLNQNEWQEAEAKTFRNPLIFVKK